MKTTLDIADRLAKRHAAARGMTLRALIEEINTETQRHREALRPSAALLS